MTTAKIYDFELELARRLKPARFGGLQLSGKNLELDLVGEFSPAAVRIICRHLLEWCDAADGEGGR